MYKFIRYFNQNRGKIIRIMVLILFGLIVLQFFNMMAADNNDYMSHNLQNQESENTSTSNINTNSVISGSGTSVTYIEETDVITQFIQYCNESNVIEAYNMLSEDCQKNIYPTLESFTQNYYENNFQSSKIYNIQRWSGSIYKVDLKENILQTGKLTDESKQDFITVVSQDGKDKLNINNYIGRINLNIQKSVENIDIKVVKKDTFINQEIYTFEIKNGNEKDVYLDDLENASKIYLVDENDVKHVANLHEISKEELHIYPHSSKTIKITFSNRYISGRDISKIIFEKVIIDNTKNERQNISINL